MNLYKATLRGRWFRKEIIFVEAHNRYNAMTCLLRNRKLPFYVTDIELEYLAQSEDE